MNMNFDISDLRYTLPNFDVNAEDFLQKPAVGYRRVRFSMKIANWSSYASSQMPTYTRYHSTEKSFPSSILRHVHVYFFPTAQYLRPHHIVEKWVSQSEAYQRQNDQCYSVVLEFRPIRSSFTRHIGPHRFPTQLLWIGSAHELTANVHAPKKSRNMHALMH